MELNYNFIKQIARNYGDAFYLFDKNLFINNFNDLLSEFRKYYKKTEIAYSYKTNYLPAICKIVDDLGGYAEIVSDMELDVAKKSGVRYDKIIFNGPFKKKQAVEDVLLNGGLVVIDNLEEFEFIINFAERNINCIFNISLRCNFDVNDSVVSRFGFDVENNQFVDVINIIKKHKNIKLKGLQCHYANRDASVWKFKVSGMLNLLNKHKMIPEYVDVGGGLYGYMPDDLKKQFTFDIPNFSDYAGIIAKEFSLAFSGLEENKKPTLFIEPGTALVGNVLKFVSVVENIKNVRGKSIATLLGSIYNINPTLNKKNPPIQVYRDTCVKTEKYEDLDFGGFTCIESDYLFKGYNGELASGDFVVFDNVGSYSIVLKPPFILPNFAVLEVGENNGVRVVKQRETFDDVFKTYIF